mmetsp:Transcript_101705/g.283170  ORF Transcript_101705/g.283170 Transcript_101705/m.283170 type:complete len:528 (-) Transcript_101705:167-1750(-)|eukprot:CAMPEP_0179112760 /NCGR_PEP_ID=MMETSP0796-20121207/52729_1 /TAXON_ID=73915 /ORGANISM="Pyrodinium bahamense, Strain pbaha01" /LENGTH=527 /DNA_ID=CAMNT_0020810947 /DNA_START=105 /DNA_END=1688 /DNA_ORIENTATION=-
MASFSAADLRTRRPNTGGSGWSASGTGGSWGGSGADGAQGGGGPDAQWHRPSAIPGGRVAPGEGGGEKSMPRELRGTFILLLVTAICLHADQNLAAPNLSAIAEDFQMTPLQKDTRLGGMVQFGFFLIGGAVSLVVGPATDQIDRVTMLSAVVLSGCVPSLAMSLWVPSTKAGFFYFFLARICTGVAIGGSFPVLFSLTADIFPASQRSFVSACISAATNIGAAVGGMMAGIVGPRFGWRSPFKIVAFPALACAVLVRVLLVDPRTERREKRAKEASAVENPAFAAWMGGEEASPAGYVRMEELDFTKFRRILDVRTNMLVFAQALPGCIPLSCIVTFLADYLAVEQGMKVQASTAVTAVFGVSCLCFAVSGGIFGQRLYSRRKDKLPLLIGTTTSLAALPFIILVNSPRSAVTSASGRPTAWAFLLALTGGCAAVAGPNIRAILMNVNDSEVRGTVFSAFTLFDDLGKGLGPSIIVAATSVLGRRLSYTLAFSLWWLSGAILLSMRDSLPRDAARSASSLLPFKSK